MFFQYEIAFPENWNTALIQYFFRGKEPNKKDLSSLSPSLQKLWPLLAKERGQQEAESHYSFDKKLAEAYAAYYLPANALKISAIIEENFLLQSPFAELMQKPVQWMDIGCGPGTLFWGLDHFSKSKNLKIAYHGFDQSKPWYAI